jgi:hypothetical protein
MCACPVVFECRFGTVPSMDDNVALTLFDEAIHVEVVDGTYRACSTTLSYQICPSVTVIDVYVMSRAVYMNYAE